MPANYKLAWRFEIVSVDPGAANEIYVDALTGAVLKMRSLECTNGPATLLYGYGTQTIDTKFHNGLFNDYYFLRAEDNRNIHTRTGSFTIHGEDWGAYSEAKDDNDNWGSAASNWTTAHWVVSQSWDYFKSTHNRNGMNGSGGKVHVLANSTDNNARFRNVGTGWIEFGTLLGGGAGAQLASIDVGGHEYTHGVTHFVAGLGGANEPGALNESFSDIFGFLVERFSGSTDWTLGEDPVPGGLRSLENPGSINIPALPDRPATGSPNVYLGLRWYAGAADDGGEHINCGPQNRWFNLLSVGGTEAETGIAVLGIGIDKAALITWTSLSAFIQGASQYADARQGAIAAATMLFGACSNEVIQTTNAWAAVGVGNVFQGNCIQITGPVHICGEPQGMPVVFHANVLAGAIVTWTVPASWGIVLSGPGNSTLTLQGIYPKPKADGIVSISATSSLGGTTAKSVWVEVDCLNHPLNPPCPPTDGRSTENDHPSKNFENPNIGKAGLLVYPNPANDVLTISTTPSGGLLNIAVVDIYGRKVVTSHSVDSNFMLDIHEFAPGIYYLKVSGTGFNETKTFIKQ
ncbi:MAG: T9SS type A sorting domain-containing protein [Saprospiraceae bacterium]|nr:MAG: T9SS type A sorting domain-containing protein [Saprospiraceae bacterium]